MKYVIITATDTSAAIIVRSGLCHGTIHAAAAAWMPRDDISALSSRIRDALGTRPRLRRYAIDRSRPGIITINFTSYKRPETIHYRGSAMAFSTKHQARPQLVLVEVDQVDLPMGDLMATPPHPEEFIQ